MTAPMDEHDAMARVLPRIEPPESFVPAVHDVRRDAVLAAAVAWRMEGDYDESLIAAQRLADAVDRYRGVA